MSQRLIRRTVNQSRNSIADLLEVVLVGELLAPGTRLLLVSPWLSDMPVIDNRSGQYGQLDSRWSATRIRFSETLRALLLRGTTLDLACRTGAREQEFVDHLRRAVEGDGTDSLLRVHQDPALVYLEQEHGKALVADNWALHGSMNFTYSGVEINGEIVTFTTDTEQVSTLAAELAPLFGEEQ